MTSNSYGAGVTEWDIVRLKATKPLPRSEDPVLALMRVWQIRCRELRLGGHPEGDWWPNQRQVERWLDNYGFEIAREAVIRGIKGFSRVLTEDKTKAVQLAETERDAIHQMNYIQRVMKNLRDLSDSGQTLVREGSVNCYE